jgi:two-component system, cell cycle sensor histidine kinase and response regulator CckA
VRDVVRGLRRLIRENITVSTELAGGDLLVEADRGQLQQVLMNLTLNASDAMPNGGTLRIRTRALDGKEVAMSVEDTGHGIPEAIRESIFEPFFTTKGPGRGTGLGLSVVHGIVTSHGGRVEVESEESQGSTFRIILPRTAATRTPGPEVVVPLVRAPEQGKGERILVAEDEPAARDGVRQILTFLGYQVTAVESGEAAEDLPADRPFDLLLTDVMLPGMLGPQVARQMKQRWPELKVVLMSGYAEDDDVRAGVLAGQVRFLQKPFTMGTLASEMRAVLEDRSDD